MIPIEERLAETLAIHFDPRWGSPYWLDRARELGFDPRRQVRTIEDLDLLGPMPLRALAERPLEHFIPARFDAVRRQLITSESGGTTGSPARTAFLDEEFEAAFVTPFVAAADFVAFPRALNWLFIGPSGPHAIGKAARECARALGSMDPFMVDFDPRWVRKLPAGSLAHHRYLNHVIEQSQDVLQSQEVGVLFATPPVLSALGDRLSEPLRMRIRGIHLGGLASSLDFLAVLTEKFPDAVVLGGYGNSLAGMCPQLGTSSDGMPEYYPHGNRLVYKVTDPDESGLGRVTFHRLDLTCFLPNVVERDMARSVGLPERVPDGFHSPGLHNPVSIANRISTSQAALY